MSVARLMLSLRWLADRPLLIVENILAGAAGMVMLFIMFTISFDVFMRYALNRPLEWAFDLMTMYLVLAAFFLPFSYTLRRKEHLAVTYFSARMPRRLRGWMAGPLLLIGSALFLTIALLAGQEAYHAWDKGYVVAGAIAWPSWISSAVVSISLVPLSFRLALLGVDELLKERAA